MRKYWIYISFLFVSHLIFGQNTFRNFGEEILVLEGTRLLVDGDVINENSLPSADVERSGLWQVSGEIALEGSLINNAREPQFREGDKNRVTFSGIQPTIMSTTPVYINELVAEGTGDLQIINTTVIIDSLVRLDGQIIELVGSELRINSEARIEGETTNLPIVFGDRLVVPSRPVADNFADMGNSGFFINTSLAGNATITRYNVVSAAGQESMNLLFKVDLNRLAAESEIGLRYSDFLLDDVDEQEDLSVYISRDSLTWRRLETLSQNTTNNVITAAVENLETAFFTIANTECPNLPALGIQQFAPLCEGESTSIIATPFGVNANEFVWNDTLISSSISVTESGNYTLTRTTSQGCVASINRQITEQPKPRAVIGGGNFVCEDSLFNFLNESRVSSGDLVFNWFFDDDAPVTGFSPSPNFDPGLHKIVLNARTSAGCEDSDTLDEFAVIRNPEINTDIQANYCLNEEITLTENSLIPEVFGRFNDAIFSRRWQVNGQDTANSSISFNPTSTGVIPVRLTVTSARECRSVLDTNITVRELPEAFFEAQSTCAERQIPISNINLQLGFNLTWFVDDSLAANGINPIFSPTNNYDLSLRVSNEFNCLDTLTRALTGIPNPTVSFTIADTCSGIPNRIVNNSFLENESLSYEWQLIGGQIGTDSLLDLTLTRIEGLDYTVTLIATSSSGCDAMQTQVVNSFDVPEVSFTATDVCQGMPTLYENNTTSTTPVTLQAYYGTEDSTAFQDEFIFTESGLKNTTLIAITAQGCTDTATISHEVFANPEFSIPDVSTCIDTIEITSPIISNNFSYLWSNGETTPSTVIRNNGIISLSVVNENNCEVVEDFFVEVDLQDTQIMISPDTLVCDGITLDAERLNSRYLWSTGATSPQITVDNSQTVNVIITDEFECQFVDTITIEVDQTPSVSINPITDACLGDTIVVEAISSTDRLVWSTGALDTTSTISIVSELIEVTALSNTGNCQSNDSVETVFFTFPVVELGNDTVVCDSLIILNEVIADVSGFINSNEDSIILRASSLVILEASNGGICVTRDSVQVEINQTPVHPDINTLTACEGNDVIIDLGIAERHTWSTGANTQILSFDSDDTVIATSINAQCEVTDTFTITFTPVPVIDLGPDTVICSNDSLFLSFVAPNFFNQWFSETRGFISMGDSISVNESDTFSVRSFSGVCEAFDTIVVQSIDVVASEFLSSSIAEVNDTVQFVQVIPTGADRYFWNFGNGFTSEEQNPTNQYFFPGEFEVTLVAQVGSCADTTRQFISIFNDGEAPIDLFLEDISELIIENAAAFPNPFSESLNVQVELSDIGEIDVFVFNLNGELLIQESFNTATLDESLDTSDLISGSYTLFVVAGRDRAMFNLLKNN